MVSQESGIVELSTLPPQARQLRVRLVEQGEEKFFGQDFVEVVQGSLATAGARVVLDDSYDLLMHFEPSFSVVEKTGDFYRVDCQVKYRLTSADGKLLFSSGIRNYPSPKRQLSLAAAKMQFRDLAARDAAQWAGEQLVCRGDALAKLGNEILGVGLVQFQYPRALDFDSQRHARKTVEYGQMLVQFPGIVSVHLHSEDAGSRCCVFRVVYTRGAFPNGLVNTIAANMKL